jgi:membrane protein
MAEQRRQWRVAASRLWSRGGRSWREVGRRLGRRIFFSDLFGRCAELAYYFLFAVFPLLYFLTALIGHLAGASAQLRASLFEYLSTVSPSPQVTGLLHSTLEQAQRGRGGAQLSLSLAAALWVASNGMTAAGRTLNTVCGLHESRPWWHRRLLALLLTAGVAVLLVAGLAIIFYGGAIGEALAARLGMEPGFISAWRWFKLPLALVFLLLSFEAVYNYAPDLGRGARRPWGTPGAATGVALWLAASFGLRLYLREALEPAGTYGSLGAVILLLIWFYVTAFALLAGGVVNAEIAQALAARRQAARERGHQPRAAKTSSSRSRRR